MSDLSCKTTCLDFMNALNCAHVILPSSPTCGMLDEPHVLRSAMLFGQEGTCRFWFAYLIQHRSNDVMVDRVLFALEKINYMLLHERTLLARWGPNL